MHSTKDFEVPANPYGEDVEAVLISQELLHARIATWRRLCPKSTKTPRTTSF